MATYESSEDAQPAEGPDEHSPHSILMNEFTRRGGQVRLMTCLEVAIETERQRLTQALAVMDCLVFVASHAPDATSGELPKDDSRLPNAAEVVRKLMGESIENLDCMNLARAMGS